MDVVKSSINKPVPVTVGIILVVMFGLIGLLDMPYQLSPTVTEPEIAVETLWLGATPYEIEREIIEAQEKVLKGIPGLVEMESSSFNDRGSVTLRFRIGTDVDDALLRVSNKLNEVPSYPENVEKPVITATGAASSPVIWMVLRPVEGNTVPIYHYQTFFEDEIRQYLERVEGVADLFTGGGTKREMQIVVDPGELASYGLTIREVIDALRAENVNVSAGVMGIGRRDYRIRTVGQFNSIEEIEQVVIRSTGQKRITLGDVARIDIGHEELTVAMLQNGEQGIAFGVQPEPGTNILALTNRVQATVDWLNQGKLAREKVYLHWAYDQRPYISGAIGLVRQNILIGGFLAVTVLLLFLRRVSSTVVVATAIPISVIGTFIFMSALGRNLNVVSLAGISFAVGMLLDNAIVVLENIDRHRRMGKSPFASAHDGTMEVWGAILASTLTTVAVFLPVIFVEEEAGQLFKDIAIAVTCAILLSLCVSVSVIPMLSNQLFRLSAGRWFSRRGGEAEGEEDAPGRRRLSDRIAALGGRIQDLIMGAVGLAVRNWRTRLVTIGGLTAFSILSVVLLMPKMEYLPEGNRNFVMNILIPPPGLSYEEKLAIGKKVFQDTAPYFRKDHEGVAGIHNMFYVGADMIMIFGAMSQHEQRAGELVPVFTRIINSIPGMFGVSKQAGIFQTRLGQGRTIDVDISGEDLNGVIGAAGAMFGMLMGELPGSQIRPIPSLETLYPEVRFLPRRDRLRAVGLNAADLGIALDVLMEGRKIGEFKEEGKKKIDLVLMGSGEAIPNPEALYEALLVTPRGDVLPVSSLVEMERTTGVSELRHLERQRTVTLQLTPPAEIPLQVAMETIESKVVAPLEAQGMLAGLDVNMSGAADKLTQTRQVLQWNFVLAALIVYLLMSALFGNFLYPLVIMFTVPLAGAGGFIGLQLVNLFIAKQSFDILTMLGFVILIGVVVNNAILIVHQSLVNVRAYGMEQMEAIRDATRTRIRPIYMSASTTIFAMLPMVVFPGPGSELYRGLGSVILGGLALSTVFTIFVIPALLAFFIRMEKGGADGMP